MFIIKYKKIFISLSIILVSLSIFSLFFFGVNVGIDFKGGALTEISYTDSRPSQDELQKSLENLTLGNILFQPTGELGYIIKSRHLNDLEHKQLLENLSLNDTYAFVEKSFNSIGPSVGKELTRKAIIAVILISLVIICFIAFSFRKVSYSLDKNNHNNHSVPSWKYGLIAIITLLHDVMIPIGLFVILSHYSGAELDTLFVVAILTILGLSVSDTIVIFDRIRENLKSENQKNNSSFSFIVGKSLEQSYVRSISTSFTVILVLIALLFFGPVTIKYFALMLITGMFFGTYSSIFLASPLLVLTKEWQDRKLSTK